MTIKIFLERLDDELRVLELRNQYAIQTVAQLRLEVAKQVRQLPAEQPTQEAQPK